MCAARYPIGEPYSLPGNRLAFTNWHFVRPCSFRWEDDEGRCVSVTGPQGPNEARFRRTEDPCNVRLRAHAAQRVGPLLTVERPWEDGGVWVNTLLKDGGVYRAWAVTGWGDLKDRGNDRFVYYESRDGYSWDRPNLGLRDYNGDANNNILHDFGGTVFLDPAAPSAERYKWVSEAHFPKDVYDEYVRRRPDAVDPKSHRADAGLYIGVRGAVSPDGLRWSVLDQPLVMLHSDTQNIAYYDTSRKTYVMYTREFAAGALAETDSPADPKQLPSWISVGRRAIGRTESADFREFPLGETILEPPVWMNPSEVLYTNCRTTIPGAPDCPLLFPTVWSQATDSTWVALATGHDGKVWHFLPNTKVFETGAFGQFDGGAIFVSPNLTELPDGAFVLPYTGYNVPHKYPRQQARRNLGYLHWPKGRLIGVESESRGSFSTPAVVAPGEKIRINALTPRAGAIRVEAARLNGEAIPGREFENAVPLTGDCYNASVAWKGHDTLGVEPGEAVILRFRLDHGCVYYVDFE